MLNVLAIGYGRHFFDPENAERARMESCAQEVGAYHMVVFTDQADGCKVQTNGNLTIHPTNSTSKIRRLFDAVRVAKQIIMQTDGSWVVTTQDPFEAGLVGYVVSRQLRVPLNVQEHGDFFSTKYWSRDLFLNRFRVILGLFILRRATTVRVVSQRIKNTLISKGVLTENILELPVRTDVLDSQEKGGDVLNIRPPEASVVVVTVCRLVTQKNVPLLLRSFQKLHAQDTNAKLVIVGSGPEEQRLKKLVTELTLSQAVTFVPWTDDPLSLIKQADIFALSSHWEGWARVLVEAMCAGVPIVTTDVGCAGEVVLDGKHGFVVSVDNEEEFTAKLLLLAAKPKLRKQQAMQAQQDARTVHVTQAEYAKRWAEIFFTTTRLK